MNEILWDILEKCNVETILNIRLINKNFNNYCKRYKKQLIRIIFRQAGYTNLGDSSYEELLDVIKKLGIYNLESVLITDYETMQGYDFKLRQFMYNNITNYNCSHSNLYYLPQMPNVRVLNCSYNKITYVPNYPKLEILLCNNNVVHFLMLKAEKIKKLDCSDNFIKRLPKLQSCEYLNCSNNFIQTLPLLPKIKYLYCSFNAISVIDNLPNIEILDCKYNKISLLEGIDNVKYLYCNNNRLVYLPCITKVQVLSANSNKLMKLPNMPNLVELYCNNNKLIYISKISEKIKKIEVKNNPQLSFLPHNLFLKNIDFNFENTNIDFKQF